jgi:hypothetical protein
METWTSDKGGEEIHHFVEGEQNTYLFGFNRDLLGDTCYLEVRSLVLERLKQLEETKREHN